MTTTKMTAVVAAALEYKTQYDAYGVAVVRRDCDEISLEEYNTAETAMIDAHTRLLEVISNYQEEHPTREH